MNGCNQIKLCKCIIYTLISVGYIAFLLIEIQSDKIDKNMIFVVYNFFSAVTILYNIIYLYSLSENIFFVNISKICFIISITINMILVLFTIFVIIYEYTQEKFFLFHQMEFFLTVLEFEEYLLVFCVV